MKTRLLIIIVFVMMIPFVILSHADPCDEGYGLSDGVCITLEEMNKDLPICNPNPKHDFGKCQKNNEAPVNKLQDVLDNCNCQESDQDCIEPELRWWNTTHFIDNIDCEFLDKVEGSPTYGLPFDNDDIGAEIELTDISSSVLTGFKITEFGMFDSENYENSVHQLYVGKKYWFWFEYQNESEKPQNIERFVKLIDKNKTEDNVLKKTKGSTTLESSMGSGGGFGWIPEYVGEFKITAKVISLNDSLVGVIAPQYDLVVIERPLLKQQLQNQTPIDDILCKKSDHFLAERTNKELACVSMDTAKKIGWKLVHFEEIILDPATKKSLLERYSDLPEVVAFYKKYDANAEVRQDHISYFAGNEDDFRVRMNLELDKNHDIENIAFHCYAQRVHQMEVAQDFILKFLEGYTCDETGAHRNKN